MRTIRLGFVQAAIAASLSVGGLSVTNATDVMVKLSGDQEVPAVTTAATASGKIVINKDKTVTGMVKTTGMIGIAAHIHLAEPGKNGPPIITLIKSGDDMWMVPDGSSLTDDQYKSFKDGNLYVNVHSPEHKSGEIRTQLKP